jgi:hypothetical protein
MPKISIREWLYTQHCPPDVLADFEKLFVLAEHWRKIGAFGYSSADAPTLVACAKNLEAILEGNEPSRK